MTYWNFRPCFTRSTILSSFFFRYLSLAFLTLLQNSLLVATSKEPPKASIVINYSSGEIIYCSNPNVRTQPASMTKMMTLMLLFKAIKEGKITQNSLIHISKHAASQKPSKMGLKCGEVITVKNAILALITKSANDVAVAVAELLGGSEKRFVKMMNREARRLGMSSTVFRNPSGWKDSEQLTTVKDMVKLSRALIREYPEFFHLFSKKGFYYRGKYYNNHNHLLGESGGVVIDGLKTGFVCASGYNIAVTAKKGCERVVVVVVGGKTAKKRDKLVRWLLTCAFNKMARQRFIAEVARDLRQGQQKKQENKTVVERENREITLQNKPIKKSGIRRLLEEVGLIPAMP